MDASRTLKKLNNKGFSPVWLFLIMFVMIFIAALVIDLGHMFVSKSQLQNAADAGALAGAGALFPKNISPPPDTPDWVAAQSSAIAFVKLNKAASTSLTDADIVSVQAGYWNLNQTPQGIQSQSTTPTVADVPAVMVSLRKQNVPLFFARIFGDTYTSSSIPAQAVAISGSIGATPGGGTFPFVLTTCVVNDYFSRNPLPNPPIDITDTSVYHMSDGTDVSPGQWTALKYDKSPSADILDSYIDYMRDPTSKGSIPSPAIQLGDEVMIDPGTMASVYHSTQTLIDAGKGLVLAPIVDCTIVPDERMTIKGFVAIQLTGTTNSSVTGHFLGQYTYFPGTQPGGGSNNNALIPPKLVK